ncbi:hypothetical protein IWX91DRAFT_330064 [Phyllosticta citricarpa]
MSSLALAVLPLRESTLSTFVSSPSPFPLSFTFFLDIDGGMGWDGMGWMFRNGWLEWLAGWLAGWHSLLLTHTYLHLHLRTWRRHGRWGFSLG